MAEGSTLKLIIQEGPRGGETLKYSPGSSIKIGRVVRGNTIAIKDAGISSNHIHIQFDKELSIWTLCDLGSSNGTVLNGQILKPYLISFLNNGDCIEIGESTSIVVNIVADSAIRPSRNPRRQAKSGSGPAGSAEKGMVELGLGFEEDLGGNEVKEPVERRNLRGRGKKAVNLNNPVGSGPAMIELGLEGNLGGIEVKEQVEKRNLRSRGKKVVELKNEVEVLSSRRVLRSSKKEEVSLITKFERVSESLNVDAVKVTDCSVPVEPRKTRGRKKVAAPASEDISLVEGKPADSVVVPVDTKRTRRRRKGLRVEPLDNVSLQVDEGKAAMFDNNLEDPSENVKRLVEILVSPQKDCEGKEADEESEYRKDGCEGAVEDTGNDNGRWQDLEKMTVSDFFDYMEVQLSKEIYDRSEKIIAALKEKACKYHEFRLQRNESGKGKIAIDKMKGYCEYNLVV